MLLVQWSVKANQQCGLGVFILNTPDGDPYHAEATRGDAKKVSKNPPGRTRHRDLLGSTGSLRTATVGRRSVSKFMGRRATQNYGTLAWVSVGSSPFQDERLQGKQCHTALRPTVDDC